MNFARLNGNKNGIYCIAISEKFDIADKFTFLNICLSIHVFLQSQVKVYGWS